MKLSQFDFQLPRRLIAQHPARRRDQSRLLILNRSDSSLAHASFPAITDYLKAGDALVVNNTKVFKARLYGERGGGGRVEVFLVRQLPDQPGEVWEALVRPSRRISPGDRVQFGSEMGAEFLDYLDRGKWQVRFGSAARRRKIVARFGHVPLPQYVGREDEAADIRRYQTVFARKDKTGAVAAPTAGFHFTRGLLSRIAEMGVAVCQVTLHVGPGTFKPIMVDNIADHTVDPEFAELSESVAATLNRVRSNGGRIYAVGTTSVRTLESAPLVRSEIQPFAQMVDTYIRPGYEFRVVDRLITNFHLPKSSLLVLVSAFAGRDQILEAYAEAIRQEYRFYSYGDAMLIL